MRVEPSRRHATNTQDMKLTKTLRDAFVRAVMADVPLVDYDEQAANIAREAIIEALPAKIRAAMKDEASAQFLRLGTYRMPGRLLDVHGLPALRDWGNDPPASIKPKLQELADAKSSQNAQREKLRGQVEAVAYSCSTRKALATALPEFEKYLPADDAAACKTLPAVANVVSDFVRAGWPKGGNKAA